MSDLDDPVFDLNPATGTMRRVEFVTRSYDTAGDLMCVCGNTPDGDGFYPCLSDGTEVEPTIGCPWDGRLYVCADCGRVIDQETLEVIVSGRCP